jgi:peptidoglycan/LPS O-acetylase OafA/YrhL
MSGEGNIGLGNKDYVRFATPKVFGLLDGLSALAIPAVVWHHANNAAPGWKIAIRGFLGLDLFFTIGAVSYGIYLYHLLVMHFVANGLAAAGTTRVLVTLSETP